LFRVTQPETAPAAAPPAGWVAGRIRARLGVLAMTHADLARAMGLSRQAVHRRLRDEPEWLWTVSELGMVAQILRLPIGALLDPDVQVAGAQLLTRPTYEATDTL
jgi:transcriptional regulator with XRE-family HTH domain